MSDFTPAAAVSDIPVGTVHGVDIDGHWIAICNVDGDISAVSGICTHADADLCEEDLDDGCLVCPLHFATFDAKTGEAMAPPADEPLRVYEVKVDGDAILVRVD